MKLTKADREAVITGALKETFAPQFEAFRERLIEHVRATLHAEHPVFCEMAKRADARRYLYITSKTSVFAGEKGHTYLMRSPEWFGRVKRDKPFCGYDVNGMVRIDTCVDRPAGGEFQPEATPELEDEYRALWEKYLDAQDALVEAVYGHTHREKFVEDFPGLAKHLPPVVSKLKALTVPAASITAKLAVLGVAAQ